MDYNELVQKITERVLSYIDNKKCDKSKLIIISHEHDTNCHKFFEDLKLNEHFCIECALNNDYECDVENSAGVIMFNLTNTDLARIVSGVCDTPFTEMASEALLLGKPVFIPKEEIELFNYDTNTPYAKMMYQKLQLLQEYGVKITSNENLSNDILGNYSPELPHKNFCDTKSLQQDDKEVLLTKKLITEKDLINVRNEGTNRVVVGVKTIITDLAKEYAHDNKIELIHR